MHEVLVNCLFKLAQENVWLGELTMIAVDLGRKATKQNKPKKAISLTNIEIMGLGIDDKTFFHVQLS